MPKVTVPPWTDTELARVQALLADGVSWREIGREMGMPSDTARARWMRSQEAFAPGRAAPRVFAGDPSPLQVAARAPADEDGEPVIDVAPVTAPGTEEGREYEAAGGVKLVQLSAMAHRAVLSAQAAAGWEHWILVTADHHFDAVDCDRALLEYQHEQAVARGAGIVAIGDVFDAMQGRMDRRAGKVALRPEYLVPHYADAIVEDAARWYGRYAAHYWLVTYGNHETKFQSVNETDILRRLVREMNRSHGTGTMLGAYRGTLSIDLVFGGEAPDQRLRVAYHHGHGGGGPVTGGAIGMQRRPLPASTTCGSAVTCTSARCGGSPSRPWTTTVAVLCATCRTW